MSRQIIIKPGVDYHEVKEILLTSTTRNILLVCDKGSMPYLEIYNYFKKISNIDIHYFSDFEPNPTYDSVVEGVKQLKANNCDMIFAVGGGSAIDVAKCIKAFSTLDESKNYLEQIIEANNIKLIAMPTTAGTGSEATKFAVIYYGGEKQSVTSDSIIPNIVVMDSSVLKTLPIYQRKCTMLDALCHSIESFWSVNATDESQDYSKNALKTILGNYKGYLANDPSANREMQKAAYIAGKAINIAQTTSGHALCYKLTSLYNIAHGHAAALCMINAWKYMVLKLDKCENESKKKELLKTFNDIVITMDEKNEECAIKRIETMLKDMDIAKPKDYKEKDFDVLVKSVNVQRLKNNPVKFNEDDIRNIYHMILG